MIKKNIMAKKIKTTEKPRELFRGKWMIAEDFPEANLDLLNKRFDAIEKWEAKRREQGPPFNEEFCANVYAIATIMTKDDSFKGKFDPDALYEEMCETMKAIRKGKKDYSFFDALKMFHQVMDNHKKKTATKK